MHFFYFRGLFEKGGEKGVVNRQPPFCPPILKLIRIPYRSVNNEVEVIALLPLSEATLLAVPQYETCICCNICQIMRNTDQYIHMQHSSFVDESAYSMWSCGRACPDMVSVPQNWRA